MYTLHLCLYPVGNISLFGLRLVYRENSTCIIFVYSLHTSLFIHSDSPELGRPGSSCFHPDTLGWALGVASGARAAEQFRTGSAWQPALIRGHREPQSAAGRFCEPQPYCAPNPQAPQPLSAAVPGGILQTQPLLLSAAVPGVSASGSLPQPLWHLHLLTVRQETGMGHTR